MFEKLLDWAISSQVPNNKNGKGSTTMYSSSLDSGEPQIRVKIWSELNRNIKEFNLIKK